jgi:hypothetical protein
MSAVVAFDLDGTLPAGATVSPYPDDRRDVLPALTGWHRCPAARVRA